MKSLKQLLLVFVLCASLISQFVLASDTKRHPRLLLTSDDVVEIKRGLGVGASPRFQRNIELTQTRVDEYFQDSPQVPIPKDAGGGHSHEQHKANGYILRDAGTLYQLTGDPKYASYVKDMLFEYAAMYPGLPEHPMKKEQTPGRLFWQSLNESVWLLHAIQGYDSIVETLTESHRDVLESQLFRVMAKFLSVESPETFDRIHNHGTWAVAAVGMTGYVLDDSELVEQALYGLNKEGSAGFLRQLDSLLSPDGYYAEGPYYQRYALLPIIVFAASIEANSPELKIFEYRDKIVEKAIFTCIGLSYNGLFFPINDAIREKGLTTPELHYGIALAYGLTHDPGLLSIAKYQDNLVLTGDGFKVARALDEQLAKPYEFRSRLLRDGSDGKQGGLAIFRSKSAGSGLSNTHQALVFKATSQGMGHGHFDKLHWMFYDNGNEIVSDYGAARFLNIEAKQGGRYLPENLTWAKQTIAHNTLVVNETSHFNADVGHAQQFHPEILYFHSESDTKSDTGVHVVSASMEEAYSDVSFRRTLLMTEDAITAGPLVVDLLEASGSGTNQFDLPLHFKGQLIDSQPPLTADLESLHPLGEDNGYQHLWFKGGTQLNSGEVFSMTWLNDNSFYTYSSLALAPTSVLFVELGANDPELSLRREQAVILRVEDAGDATFLSTLEVHGDYNAAQEFTIGSEGSITGIQLTETDSLDLIEFEVSDTHHKYLAISHDIDARPQHSISSGNRSFEWQGFFNLFD